MEVAGGWPRCISGALVYEEQGQIRILDDTPALFAWIAGHCPVHWQRGDRAVTKAEFYERLMQHERWDWATAHPHFPAVPGVYYLAEPPAAEHNGALDALLDRFCPLTPLDREVMRALVLTLYWGGLPGKRPQFAFAADESEGEEAGRGTGKTAVPQAL
jgi:hypothetical protein